MDPSSDVIKEAFALSRARGAALLARLGDVWRGDLADMRGDSPRGTAVLVEGSSEAELLRNVLLMARAIELLPPVCRATLAAKYLEKRDIGALARELETEPEHAGKIVLRCEKRLAEIHEELRLTQPSESTTTPEWVAEREHAATAGDHRHRR